MKLFHAPGSRSLRVLWTVEEMGLECETIPAAFQKPDPAFLAVNPTRTIPAFVDGETVILESTAIIAYLATTKGPTPLWVNPDEAEYADFLQYLIFGEAGLAAPLNSLVGTRFMAPPEQKQNFTAAIVEEGFLRRLKLVEQRLQGRDYLAAGRFTLADISVAYTIGLAAGLLDMGDKMPKRVLDWAEGLKQRPAYQRAAAR